MDCCVCKLLTRRQEVPKGRVTKWRNSLIIWIQDSVRLVKGLKKRLEQPENEESMNSSTTLATMDSTRNNLVSELLAKLINSRFLLVCKVSMRTRQNLRREQEENKKRAEEEDQRRTRLEEDEQIKKKCLEIVAERVQVFPSVSKREVQEELEELQALARSELDRFNAMKAAGGDVSHFELDPSAVAILPHITSEVLAAYEKKLQAVSARGKRKVGGRGGKGWKGQKGARGRRTAEPIEGSFRENNESDPDQEQPSSSQEAAPESLLDISALVKRLVPEIQKILLQTRSVSEPADVISGNITSFADSQLPPGRVPSPAPPSTRTHPASEGEGSDDVICIGTKKRSLPIEEIPTIAKKTRRNPNSKATSFCILNGILESPPRVTERDIITSLSALGIWSVTELDVVPSKVTQLLCGGEHRYCLNFSVTAEAVQLSAELNCLIKRSDYGVIAQRRNEICHGDAEQAYMYLYGGVVTEMESATAVFLRGMFFSIKSARVFKRILYEPTRLTVTTHSGETRQIGFEDVCKPEFHVHSKLAMNALTARGQHLIQDKIRKIETVSTVN